MLFFVARSALGNAKQLWANDGTSTVFLMDNVADTIDTEMFEQQFAELNGELFFRRTYALNFDLWKTDGTSAGTVPVTATQFFSDLESMDGALYFLSVGLSGASSLWTSDGTAGGTTPLAQFGPLPPPQEPPALVGANGTLFFFADDGIHGRELWKSDGTAGGTVLVEDAFPLTPDPALRHLTAVGSRVVYSGDAAGSEPWTSDGTPAGTHRVADVAPLGGSEPGPFVQSGSLVFFAAHTDSTGRELWAVPAAALADGDQDGLDDQDEVAQGTDPDDADSDDDGLSDGAEVLTHGTDALDADTDGDGYSDGEEVDVLGSDPLDPNDPDPAPEVPLSGPWALLALAGMLLVNGVAVLARSRRGRCA
jgi:ELWxxDGT repeat protein